MTEEIDLDRGVDRDEVRYSSQSRQSMCESNVGKRDVVPTSLLIKFGGSDEGVGDDRGAASTIL